MNLQNKKKKLSIRVVIHPCKASAAGVYSLAIRVLYCRKKKEYSLGWRVHESNYRRDADRVVYSSEGILTRREVSLVNRLIRNEKEDLVRNYRLLERTDPGFTLERLMLKHRKEQYDQSVINSSCNTSIPCSKRGSKALPLPTQAGCTRCCAFAV